MSWNLISRMIDILSDTLCCVKSLDNMISHSTLQLIFTFRNISVKIFIICVNMNNENDLIRSTCQFCDVVALHR